ncbi:MAG: RNA 2',3'-cyclic phosphodiesterase [Parachlamydiaceae bacterium]|nr:RNA 2',3'-cyclic phosphodiesterase [Parachlamydiaceae bacterium]
MNTYLIGVELPTPIKKDLSLVCSGLQSVDWIPEENFFITLRYLGEINDSLFAEIKDRLSTINFLTLQLSLFGIEANITKGNHCSIWTNVNPSEKIIKLKHEIDKALVNLNQIPNEKSFQPHVMLGHSNQVSSQRLADYLAYHSFYQTEPFTINNFVLSTVHNTPNKTLFRTIEKYPKLLS